MHYSVYFEIYATHFILVKYKYASFVLFIAY